MPIKARDLEYHVDEALTVNLFTAVGAQSSTDATSRPSPTEEGSRTKSASQSVNSVDTVDIWFRNSTHLSQPCCGYWMCASCEAFF